MRWGPISLLPPLGQDHTASPAWTLTWTCAVGEIYTKHQTRLPDAILCDGTEARALARSSVAYGTQVVFAMLEPCSFGFLSARASEDRLGAWSPLV